MRCIPFHKEEKKILHQIWSLFILSMNDPICVWMRKKKHWKIQSTHIHTLPEWTGIKICTEKYSIDIFGYVSIRMLFIVRWRFGHTFLTGSLDGPFCKPTIKTFYTYTRLRCICCVYLCYWRLCVLCMCGRWSKSIQCWCLCVYKRAL